MKVTVHFRPVRFCVSMMRCALCSSVVIGFSVITSQPNSIARQMYWSCVASFDVTITVSGFVSAIMRSNSVSRYTGTSRSRPAAQSARVRSRPRLLSHNATNSLVSRYCSATANEYMNERSPTPTWA